MSEVPIEELAPRLNPDYWNGHSLGYGEATPIPPPGSASVMSPLSKGDLRGFKDRVASMERVVPLETFSAGETFDPSNYHDGTLVMFRQEELRGNPGQLNVNVESLKGQDLPERPTDFSLDFGRYASDSEFLVSGPVSYSSRVMCGVVAAAAGDKNVVHAVSSRLIERVGGGRVYLLGALWRTYPNPLQTGEVTHSIGVRSETVHRVNLLEVIAYGHRATKKEKVKALVSKLALGHQGT